MSATAGEPAPGRRASTTAGAAQYDERTALLVVDLQNDFARPDGRLYVRGGEDVVPVVNAELAAARAAGATIVLTQDWHPERTPHFDIDGGAWPVHCVAGTQGAELVDDLAVSAAEVTSGGVAVLRKGTGGEDGYSGFSVRDPVSGDVSRTRLQALLDEAGVRRVVVTGLAGDVCVAETALDAARLGYEVVVPLAATRHVELAPGDGERAEARLTAAGVQLLPT